MKGFKLEIRKCPSIFALAPIIALIDFILNDEFQRVGLVRKLKVQFVNGIMLVIPALIFVDFPSPIKDALPVSKDQKVWIWVRRLFIIRSGLFFPQAKLDVIYTK